MPIIKNFLNFFKKEPSEFDNIISGFITRVERIKKSGKPSPYRFKRNNEKNGGEIWDRYKIEFDDVNLYVLKAYSPKGFHTSHIIEYKKQGGIFKNNRTLFFIMLKGDNLDEYIQPSIKIAEKLYNSVAESWISHKKYEKIEKLEAEINPRLINWILIFGIKNIIHATHHKTLRTYKTHQSLFLSFSI